MMGRPVFAVLPHAKGLGFETLLDNVRLTGESFKGVGLPVPLIRNGILETVYTNFVYEPFRETDGTITGVIAVATEVTELVNAKDQLEEAEARARLAVDSVGLGTFDLDLVSAEMITSKQFANIFGFDEPVPRSEYVTVFHPDDLAERKAAHEAAIVSGKLLYEARVYWKDKSVHWLRVEGKVFYNNGTATRIIGILLDITDQRKAKEEQRKLISLVDNSVDLVSILNMDGINSYINAAGKELLGFENDEQATSIPISQLHTPEGFEIGAKRSDTNGNVEGKMVGNYAGASF
ncbi:MAG: PAS domain S-box protein [Bacteroidota bacterium]